MKYSFDRYHESVLRVSSLLNGDEIKFDNGIVLDIEKHACSDDEIEPILYYYKLVMLILLRSKIVKDPANVSFEEVRPLIDFVQSWSKPAIDDLAKVYDSVRPFIKK